MTGLRLLLNDHSAWLSGWSRGAFALAASLLILGAAGCGGDDEDGANPGGRDATESPPETRTGTTARDGRHAKPRGRGRAKTPDAGRGTSLGSAKDKKAIRALLVTAFESDDPDVTCTRVLTAKLLKQLYGDEAGCRRSQAANDEDAKDPDRVAVSMIEVQGRRATAHVRLIGGEIKGAQGSVSLADGARGWRIDDLSAGLLRSTISVALAGEQKIPAAVSDCMDRRLKRMPDRSLKELTYGGIGSKAQAERRIVELISSCERAAGRTPTLVRQFLEGVAKELRKAGAPRQVIDCVTRRLSPSVSVERLLEFSRMGRARGRARARRMVAAALSTCVPREGNDRRD